MYAFTGEIDVMFTPEPLSILLLGTMVVPIVGALDRKLRSK
jgi:hypothetical protein